MLAPMILLATCCIAASAWLAPTTIAPDTGWVRVAHDGRAPLEVDRRRVGRALGRVSLVVRARAPVAAVAAEFDAAGVDRDTVTRLRAHYDHSEHVWSFQCADGTHALTRSAYHSADGTLIRAFDVAPVRFWPVRADSVGGTLLRTACGATGADAALHDEEVADAPWRDARPRLFTGEHTVPEDASGAIVR
jgi:hypothetical protein